MARVSSATGFIAQPTLMTYATPQISHIKNDGFETWTAARQIGNLDWEPQLVGVESMTGHPIPDMNAVWNSKLLLSPNGYIGTVSSRYQLINHDLLGTIVEAAQTMTSETPDRITGLVSLNDGRRVGVRITRGEFTLPFDPSPISQESWIWLRHDAKGSLFCIENAHRLTCTNNLGFVGRGTTTDLHVRHVGDVEGKVRSLIRALKKKADWDLWEKEMTQLNESTLTWTDWSEFVNQYIPVASEDVSTNVTQALNSRKQLNTLFENYQTELGTTKYSAYQAVTEYEDQVRAAHGEAGRFNRAIQPNPRKAVALDMLKELV